MPDWLAIVKAYVDTLETIVGTEGGIALANKLTAVRAALLDEITALRMAELDPANLPADIAAILADVTGIAGAAMRGTDNAALAASWTAALATALGNYTAARAGYLDNINNADLANVIRDIAQATGTFAFNESSALEQTIFSVVVAARAKVGAVWLDLNTLTLDNTIRIKHKIDGATYRTFSTNSWVFATDDKGVLIEGFTAYRDFQVTMQCAGGGAAGKNVPYAVV